MRVGRYRPGGRGGAGRVLAYRHHRRGAQSEKARAVGRTWARGWGSATRFCGLDGDGLADEVAAAGVLVSTIPAEVAARYAGTLAGVPVLLDAIYDPWPTPLAAAVEAAGGRVISGLQMLLHQAFAQVEQFTGLPAPREAMACALAELG